LASFAVNFFLLIAERWIPKLLLVVEQTDAIPRI
jgi:hypothetical protein